MKLQELSYTLLCDNCKTFNPIRNSFIVIDHDINSKDDALEFLTENSSITCNDCHSNNVRFRNIEIDGKSFNKLREKINFATIYDENETDNLISNCSGLELSRTNSSTEKEFNLYLKINDFYDKTKWKLTGEMTYDNVKYIVFDEQISGRIALNKEVVTRYLFVTFNRAGEPGNMGKINGFSFKYNT